MPITAIREDSEEETKETLNINVLLDSSKFSNPNGTYPFHGDESEAAPINYAQADYKIGEQVLGRGEGYLKLSGTFNLDMYTYTSEDTFIKIEIREGSFNVEHDPLF